MPSACLPPLADSLDERCSSACTYGPMRFDSADRNATFSRTLKTSHVVWREERYPHRIPYAVEKHCYVHSIWPARRQRACMHAVPLRQMCAGTDWPWGTFTA